MQTLVTPSKHICYIHFIFKQSKKTCEVEIPVFVFRPNRLISRLVLDVFEAKSTDQSIESTDQSIDSTDQSNFSCCQNLDFDKFPFQTAANC